MFLAAVVALAVSIRVPKAVKVNRADLPVIACLTAIPATHRPSRRITPMVATTAVTVIDRLRRAAPLVPAIAARVVPVAIVVRVARVVRASPVAIAAPAATRAAHAVRAVTAVATAAAVAARGAIAKRPFD